MKTGHIATFLLCMAGLFAPGCDRSDPGHGATTPSDEQTGWLKVAIGADVREFALTNGKCRISPEQGRDLLFVRAYSASPLTTPDDASGHPQLVSARLPADLGPDEIEFSHATNTPYLQATASVFAATYDDRDYPLLQVIGAAVEGVGHEFSCRARLERSDDDTKLHLTCNKARVFPWRAPGPLPTGAFQAVFSCP